MAVNKRNIIKPSKIKNVTKKVKDDDVKLTKQEKRYINAYKSLYGYQKTQGYEFKGDILSTKALKSYYGSADIESILAERYVHSREYTNNIIKHALKIDIILTEKDILTNSPAVQEFWRTIENEGGWDEVYNGWDS